MTINTTTSNTPLADQAKHYGRDWLHLFSILLALIGTGIAGYLVYVKYADKAIICSNNDKISCEAVQSSAYADLFGIPVPVLGLAAYLTFLVLLVLEDRVELVTLYGRTIMFGLTMFGLMFSGYLTYIEAFVLEKWCLWCVASAIVMVLLFITSTIRAFQFTEIEEEG